MIVNDISIVIGSWGSYNACNERALGSKWLNLSEYSDWEDITEELKEEGFELDGIDYVMLVVGDLYGKSYNGRAITNSIEFADVLLEAEKVATVPGISFGAEDCVRLSYALSEADIEEGLKRIKRFVEALV